MKTNQKKIFEEVAEITGEDPQLVKKTIWAFAHGVKKLFLKYKWIKIKGYFAFRLSKKYYPLWKKIHRRDEDK